MNNFHFARLVGSLLQLMTSCYSDSDRIRLVNGHNDCAGRVEVFERGKWGTVCDDYWDIKDARVVCKQLGCGNAVIALGNAYFGEGVDDILLDNVFCNGWESDLTNCRHKREEEINCEHEEDASVICADPGLCQLNPYACGLNADCFNIPNSYSCACYEGYRQSYSQILISASNPCQDIDECFDDPDICGPNAECINLVGSHDCACHLGYSVDIAGSRPNITNPCEDEDECVPDLCGTHAQCYNTPGSYYCICEDGYMASPDPYWQIGITVCESVQEYLDAFIAPEGQSQETFILNEIETFLETNPDIVLPEKTVADTLTLALSVAANISFVDGLNDTISLPSAVLRITEGLGSALVEPTETYDNKSVQTEISSVAIGPEWDTAEIQTLVAMRNVMTINLTAVAVKNNGSAAAVLMSFSNMEKFIYPNFSESENVSKMYSDIITAALPKTRYRELPEPVKFTLYHRKTLQVGRIACVYWEDDLLEADWSEEGCTNSFSNENYTECSCTHLSTFALLLQTEKQEENEDDSLLETVNLFCMCVGLTFLAAAILTFLLFSWNPKINNTARLHLCICLFTGHLLFLVGVSRTEDAVACAAIAGILHFLFLASFVWMLLETLQLFLLIRSLTKVQVIYREGLKAQYLLLTGYGTPVVVVGVSAAVFPHGYGSKDQCWLNDAKHFQWSFIGPVCAILSLNLVSFCVIIWSLQPTLASMKSDISQSKDTRLITFKICAQFFVLGCSWILGFFQSSVTLKYIFIILNSQQGTFIFIVHCLLNKEVRAAYRRLLSCQWGPERPSTGKSREETIKDSEDSTSQPTEDTNRADHNH